MSVLRRRAAELGTTVQRIVSRDAAAERQARMTENDPRKEESHESSNR
jgi:hypothetical protein